MILFKDFPLKDILYYRIGGKAQFLAEIHNRKDLKEALEFAANNNITNILPLGLGSNILISDNVFNGLVLWFTKGNKHLIKRKSEDIIEAFASNTLDEVINFAFQHHLNGLEWAGGLPSTVGAAVRGNVGAFGGSIAQSVEKIEVFKPADNGYKLEELDNKDLDFSYRESFIKRNKRMIVSLVYFRLTTASDLQTEKAKEEYHAHIEYRRKNHPMEYPSCGSVFKNIADSGQIKKIMEIWPDVQTLIKENWHGKVSMGYVIKRLGFSGSRIGGAEVSIKHANYIINKNNARFPDVTGLIDAIKQRFYATFSFYPETEIEIIY